MNWLAALHRKITLHHSQSVRCLISLTLFHIFFPQFSKTFILEYRFEEIQNLKFVVYDVDDRRRVEDVSRHDLIGQLECNLAEIVTSGQQYSRTLRKPGAGRFGKPLFHIQCTGISYLLSSSSTKTPSSDLVEGLII